MRFTNIDRLNAIESWQHSNMHPLTCGECGQDMYGEIEDEEVILKCYCGNVQYYVPEVVYKRYKEMFKEEVS